MHAVRRHILEVLKERNGATVSELADALAMAPVSVRHHLDILQADNLIRVERTARSGAVGRPQQIYALTDEAEEYFPNNFAALAGKLVEQVKQVLPPEQVEEIFRSLAHELALECDAPSEAESLEERVQRVAEFLSARGYLASYEPACDGEGAFLIHKHHCPYAGVSREHGELCIMDQALVDALFGQSCERVAHMGGDGHCCTYRVHLDQSAGDALAEAVILPTRSSILLVADVQAA